MSRLLEQNLEKLMGFIEDYIDENGYAPSVREICAFLNVRSTATAHYYLEKLESRGLIRKDPSKNRAVVPKNKPQADYISVPLIGRVTAGEPITAVENLEDYYPLPSDFASASSELFMLSVRGESMIDAGIYSGDKIVVRKQETANNGDIVVALIDDSATVKRFYRRNGKVVLHPENESMSDIVLDGGVTVLGKVIGLVRKF